MGAAFKVRLDDGVEVGPLDVDMLRSWYQQGMIHARSPVRPAGKKQWVKLSDIADVSDWEDPGGGAGDDEEVYQDLGPQTWRRWLAAAILFGGAAASAYFLFVPQAWTPALAGAPWREIALGHLLLGLMLVGGWDTGRKMARVIVGLLTFSLIPLAGFVLFDGTQLRFHAGIVAILVGAWIVGSGLFFLLEGDPMRWVSIALCLFWITAGAATIGYFGFVAPGTSPAAATAGTAPS
jgi:hypothetical protein